MDKDFENYFKFIGGMLDDDPFLSKSAKMKMIKNMTKGLVVKKLSDYSNQNTKLFNDYVDKLRKEP